MKSPAHFSSVDEWHSYTLTVSPKDIKQHLPSLLKERHPLLETWFLHYFDYHFEHGCSAPAWKKADADAFLGRTLQRRMHDIESQELHHIMSVILHSPSTFKRFEWSILPLAQQYLKHIGGLDNAPTLLRENPILHVARQTVRSHVIDEYTFLKNASPWCALIPEFRIYLPRMKNTSTFLNEHIEELQTWMTPSRFDMLKDTLFVTSEMDIDFYTLWDKNNSVDGSAEITLVF